MTLGEALETVPIEDDISLLVMEYANMVRALKIISNAYIQQQSELSRLQKENEQLKELLRLAVGDMSIGWLCAVCSKRTKGKEWAMCQYQAFASVFDEERTVTCTNFEWQHADKLKGLIEI